MIRSMVNTLTIFFTESGDGKCNKSNINKYSLFLINGIAFSSPFDFCFSSSFKIRIYRYKPKIYEYSIQSHKFRSPKHSFDDRKR